MSDPETMILDTRPCDWCGTAFVAQRVTVDRFCRTACRQAAYRARHNGATVPKLPGTMPVSLLGVAVDRLDAIERSLVTPKAREYYVARDGARIAEYAAVLAEVVARLGLSAGGVSAGESASSTT